ncbi:ribonuclease H-like protein, partial [Paxillus ammoniavirescens]
ETDELFLECPCCDRFLGYCCPHSQLPSRNQRSIYFSDGEGKPKNLCHEYAIAFVGGACLGNGQENATAGVGVAIGSESTMQWAIPIDHSVDPSHVRTSQRAELIAAIEGIRRLGEYDGPWEKAGPGSARDRTTWVITSDSEYLVSGITECVPAWRRNGWRTSCKKRPKNLDLFQKLDTTIEAHEREHRVQVAFWRIGRQYNNIAGGLAGTAARNLALETAPRV